MPRYDIIWDVKDFATVTQVGESIWSPPFFLEGPGASFQLVVYPRGRTSNGYVSVFLHSLSKEHLQVGFHFFALQQPFYFNNDRNSSSFISKYDLSPYNEVSFHVSCGFMHGCDKFVQFRGLDNLVFGCYIGSLCKVDSSPSNVENISIASRLYQMYQNGEDTDVSLVFGDNSIKCHKFVLCARSTVLKAMLTNSASLESQTQTVTVQDFSYEAMKIFVDRLYNYRPFDTQQDNIEEILLISDYYDVEDIKENCVQYLLKTGNTDEHNVLQVIIAAFKTQRRDLLHHCVRILASDPRLMKTEEYANLLVQYPILGCDICLSLGLQACNSLVVFKVIQF